MRTVHKYHAPLFANTTVAMREGALIVSVRTLPPEGSMSSQLVVWAIVDPDAPFELVHLAVRGTGHDLGDVGAHIATVHDDPFVWHIFEAPSTKNAAEPGDD